MKNRAVFALLLSFFVLLSNSLGSRAMADIKLGADQTEWQILEQLQASLLGSHISKVSSKFEVGSYRRIFALDTSGSGEEDFFDNTQNIENFTGEINLVVILKKDTIFSLHSPRVSVIMSIENGYVEDISGVTRTSK